MKLLLTTWFMGMQLLTQAKTHMSALKLSRDPAVSHKSALLIKHKVMETMRLRKEPRRLIGRVEINEVDLGGECSEG